MATPLTDSINALTTYANEVTGASDTTLSDAVHTLASGYGQGGGSGLEYETGTYTAAADERPEISFANSHSTPPDILIFADVSTSAPSTGNTLSAYCRFNYQSLFGSALATPTAQNAAYGYGRLTSNMYYASALANDTTDAVTSSGFKPYAGTANFTCKSGQTYKWIAIWAPTS